MRTLICPGCGKVEDTHSKVEMCLVCCFTRKKAKRVQRERKHLTELGYTVLETLDIGQGKYRVLAPKCGHKFSPKYGNVLKQLRITISPPCRVCGANTRVKKAQAAFKAKYGRDPATDYKDWMDYNMMVRRLTQANYVANKNILNPEKHPRTVDGWHLDHRVPVSVCFDEGITIERATSLENLEMIQAQANLQKSKFVFNLLILEKLRS
jgi:hypothetical protein